MRKGEQSSSLTERAVESVLWKLLQNGGTTIISFLLQIWLARLLMPTDYGLVALTSVFVNLSMIVIQTGFTSALIQKPVLEEIDIHSIHYASIGISILLYLLIYILSPMISHFYSEPLLGKVLRLQALTIPISAFYSVPMSIIQRNLQLKKTFYAGIAGMIGQGMVGIYLALNGFGIWALVYGSLTNAALTSLVILLASKWRPRFEYSNTPVRKMLPFSSRILAINLINSLSANLKSLITGRAYSPELLGYYNRGFQFPSLLMINIDGAITSVAFPLFSRFQHDYNDLSKKVRKSLQMSLYFVWPAMIGLIVVANPLITFLLTEKWIVSVIFLQLTAIECMLWPFSIFIHATNAIGRSGLSLKLNLLSKGFDVLVMLFSIRFGIYVFVASTIISSFISTTIVVVIVSRMIGIRFRDLILDILPILGVSLVMGLVVVAVGQFLSLPMLKLIIQTFVGGTFYLLITWAMKFPSLLFVYSYIKKQFFEKYRNRKA